MSDKSFVDTNVFVYSRDSSEPKKQQQASDILDSLWRGRTGRTSVQVCNEYMAVVTGKITHPLSLEEAWEDVEDLLSWRPVALDDECLRIARHAAARYGLSWWDSLIIAAASIADCRTIFSEDFNPGQDYLGMEVVDPFSGSRPR